MEGVGSAERERKRERSGEEIDASPDRFLMFSVTPGSNLSTVLTVCRQLCFARSLSPENKPSVQSNTVKMALGPAASGSGHPVMRSTKKRNGVGG